MPFLRNTWYCAGWSRELTDQPIAITLLNEPVVLYRRKDGAVAALEDRCPHRFAPLSRGKVQGDNIACGYHGLVFNSEGSCTHNPHGDGRISERCNVKSYSVFESQGVIWIWMGDAEKSDPATIIDIGEPDGRSGWAVVNGYLKVKSHYELITDNLMDLSHVPYLHSFLSGDGEFPPDFKEVRELNAEEDSIWSMHWNYNMPVTPLYQLLWDEAPSIGTLRAHMRWQPPASLYLDTGFSDSDGEIEDGACFPGIHLITPETENSTHYFWAVARNKKIDDEKLSEGIRAQISNAFEMEDEPMIEACNERMLGTDLLALKPVILPGDNAAVHVRRKLQKLIQSEES